MAPPNINRQDTNRRLWNTYLNRVSGNAATTQPGLNAAPEPQNTHNRITIPQETVADQEMQLFEEALSSVATFTDPGSNTGTLTIDMVSAAITRLQQHRATRNNRSSSTRLSRRNALVPGQNPIPQRRSMSNPSVHPQFRAKSVCLLYCKHCSTELCRRGMKAILLGNTKVELFSTDTPPSGVQLVFQDYMTQNCACRIRDGACLGCGM